MWRLHRPLTFQRVAKKGDLERLISLKLSSQPQSQPVCSHQPDTGPHQKNHPEYLQRNSHREAPSSRRTLYWHTGPAVCKHPEMRMNEWRKKKKKGWYRPGLQLTTRHLLVSARGRCERRWKTALYMKISIRGSGCMDHNPGFLSTTEQRSHLSWEKKFCCEFACLEEWSCNTFRSSPTNKRMQLNTLAFRSSMRRQSQDWWKNRQGQI